MFTYWPSRLAPTRRITWIAALSAVLLAVSVAVLSGSAANGTALSVSPSSAATVGPGLSALASSHPSQRVQVIVQFTRGTPSSTQRSMVAAAGGQVTRDLHIINGLGVRLTAAAANRLASDPRVHVVSLDAEVRSSDNGFVWCGNGLTTCNLRENDIATTRTAGAWNQGFSGESVGVAVVDTGIAGQLTDFQQSLTDKSSRVIAAVAENPDATSPYDDYGHGTHVAGLIAGNSHNRTDILNGAYMGTAPNANLIDIKASDDQGNTSLIDVIYGLQFAVDHQADYNIRVVNLSLDSTVAQSYTTDPLDAAVEAAWNSGIVVVAASGNRGNAPDAVDYAPANDPYVLTVGGVDDTGDKLPRFNTAATWSSAGTTQDGFAKPELVAPGAHMVSTLAPGSLFTQLCPDCVVDNDYFKLSGTSMAAAVVSGIAADVVSAHPDWSPDQIKTALIQTASKAVKGTALEPDTARAVDLNESNIDGDVNAGLTPNSLIDPNTGLIDYSRASWSRASWSRASWSRASWSRASWSCAMCDPTGGSVDPSRASWSRASWSRASWSSFLQDNLPPAQPVPGNKNSTSESHQELAGTNWDLKWQHLQKPHPWQALKDLQPFGSAG